MFHLERILLLAGNKGIELSKLLYALSLSKTWIGHRFD